MGCSRMVIDQQNKFWEELAPVGEKVCVYCVMYRAFCLFPFWSKTGISKFIPQDYVFFAE